MKRINTFLILCGFLIVIIFVLGWNPNSSPESYIPGTMPPDSSLGLTYLNQYESQDWYRENPSIWPISNIPPTVRFDILRGRS